MNNKSSTLIELLVVIVIIGILAGVIMISTSSSITKASITKLKVFEESIANNLAANMISRWKLDEVIGTAVPYTTQDAWGSNTGTLGNGTCAQGSGTCPTFILDSSNQCVSGNCMNFNGSTNYIGVLNNTSFKPTDKITVSAWGNATDWTTMPDTRLVSCSEGGGYNISFSGVASAANIYINGAYRAREFYNTAISPGWHLFTFTYDNRYLKVYFDGVYKNQYDLTANYPISYHLTNSLMIGAGSRSCNYSCWTIFFRKNR